MGQLFGAVCFSVFVFVCASQQRPFLPPLLVFNNGTQVTTGTAWLERRLEIAELLQETILGKLPVTVPQLVDSELLNRTEDTMRGVASSFVMLSFDVRAGGSAVATVNFTIEVVVPLAKQSASRPLFLTQWNHREWALIGVGRGYIGVVYPGADTRDAAPDFQAAYPHSTMALIIARAFVASRTLDALLGSSCTACTAALAPAVIISSQVCITGHSRNGKQSLIAAAFDTRITAVVGSSPGAPISSPYHFSSSNYYGEGPTTGGVAGKWWVESILNYTAHPERLPMDGHGVVGLIAPRAAAIADGWTDHEGDSTFADEMNVKESIKPYSLLGHPEALRILHRPGDHHGFDDVNSYFDWFDRHYGRLTSGFGGDLDAAVPMRFLTPAGFDWSTWHRLAAPHSQPPPPSSSLKSRVSWLLQSDEPDALSPGSGYAEETSDFTYISDMLGHELERNNAAIRRQAISFGDYTTANLYYPSAWEDDLSRSRPVVIWLHPYAYATGYTPAYRQAHVPVELVKAGFMVMCFDQIGFASRLLEGGNTFYSRHGGRASLFGHMLRDVRAAVDFLHCLSPKGRSGTRCSTGGGGPDVRKQIPFVDTTRLLAIGYALGGNVALHAAALDTRITGVAAFASFTPYKTDTLDKPTGGIRRLYEMHALIPRLGLFVDNMDKIPYEYDELISAIAPRDVLLYTPQQDRDATFADVSACAQAAAKAWSKGHSERFQHESPNDYTRMELEQANVAAEWAVRVVNQTGEAGATKYLPLHSHSIMRKI